jgi:hypothetical protein
MQLGTCSNDPDRSCTSGSFIGTCSGDVTTSCTVDGDCPGATGPCENNTDCPPVPPDTAFGVCEGSEDADGDGLLDAGGQPFSLVIAGPVFGIGSQSWEGSTHSFPDSQVVIDKTLYTCSDTLTVSVFDSNATTAGDVSLNTVVKVVREGRRFLEHRRG